MSAHHRQARRIDGQKLLELILAESPKTLFVTLLFGGHDVSLAPSLGRVFDYGQIGLRSTGGGGVGFVCVGSAHSIFWEPSMFRGPSGVSRALFWREVFSWPLKCVLTFRGEPFFSLQSLSAHDETEPLSLFPFALFTRGSHSWSRCRSEVSRCHVTAVWLGEDPVSHPVSHPVSSLILHPGALLLQFIATNQCYR